MTAPITNQNYTQQINQAFDFLKNATPQQMQAVGEQVQGNPQSPEAMALAMAAQYQQQMRSAQQPPAPQGTILQQKLGEFQQQAGPAQGGIPAVGMNQMGVQQAAQSDPMRNAGIAVAPENKAPIQTQPQQTPQGIATGGIAALAHGGEVRHFDIGGELTTTGRDLATTGGDLATRNGSSLSNIEPGRSSKFMGDLETIKPPRLTGPSSSAASLGKQALMGRAATGLGALLYSKDVGEGSDFKGTNERPDAFKDDNDSYDMPKDFVVTDPSAGWDGGYGLLQDFGVTDPSAGGDGGYVLPKDFGVTDPSAGWDKSGLAAIKAPLSYEPETPKLVIPAEGKDDVIHAPADTSSAKAIAKSPSAKEQIKSIADLLGPEADISEEIDMAKQASADARRDKMLGAMTQGIGGMLSAQTPHIGQALGAGLMAGASGYSQGAKDEQAANKDLMALQMAHKKALLSGNQDAAKMYLSSMMAKDTAVAAARAKAQELKTEHTFRLEEGKQTGQFGLSKEQMQGQNALNLEQFKSNNAQLLEQVKSDIDSGGLKPQHQKDIFNALINSGVSPDEAQTMIPGIIKTLTATSAKAPTSSFSGFGSNAKPLQGGLFRSPAPTQ